MKHPVMRHLAFAGALAALSLPADAPAMKWGLIATAPDDADPVLVLEGEGSWRPSSLMAPAAVRRVRPVATTSAADIWRRAMAPDPCGDGQIGLSCPGQGADLGVGQGAPLALGLGAPVTDWTRLSEGEERAQGAPRAGSEMGWMSLFPVLGSWAPVGRSTGTPGGAGGSGGGGSMGVNPLASAAPMGGGSGAGGSYPTSTSGGGATQGTVDGGSGSSGGASSNGGSTDGGSGGGGTTGGGASGSGSGTDSGGGSGSGGYPPVIPTELVPREPALQPLATPVGLPGTLLLMALGVGALASVRSHRRPN